MRGNKVFLNKQDIIEINVVGDQTPSSVAAMGDEVAKLAEQRRKAKKPVLVLDDLMKMGDVPPEGRKVVVEYGKTLDYDKLAMVGNSAILRLGANLMLRATGRAEKIKYFDNYEEAFAWLKA